MAVELHPDLKNSEFTLEDLAFPPTKIPDFELGEVDLSAQLTPRIKLEKPIVGSPMDSVTEHDMAIFLARQGAIGVIHYNFPTINSQMEEVVKVRRFKAGFVRDPVVLGPNATVEDVYKAVRANGFYSYPITEDGTRETPVIGMVTHRDIRYEEEDCTKNVCEVMTPRGSLIVADSRTTLDCNDIDYALQILKDRRLDTLPIVDNDFTVVALVTDSDVAKSKTYPQATQDENGQLKVLVAVESRFTCLTRERIMAARDAGASGIIPDSRNVYASHLEIAHFVRENAPEVDRFAEGITKTIPYKGPGEESFRRLFAGFRQGMHGLGHRNIAELQRDGFIVPAYKAATKGTL